MVRQVSSAVFLAALVLGPLVATNFVTFQMTMLLVYAIAILALNILTGSSGQFSLGQSAFFAIGAYTSAVLIEHGGVNYLLTLPIAALVCFVTGFLFGLPALRLSGVYLALATFALATAMPQILKLGYFEPWTGGVQGLVTTKPDAPFGLPISPDTWLYYLTLAFSLAIYAAAANLLSSRTGRAMMAIRDNEIAASAMGVDVALYKTLAFGISAAVRNRRRSGSNCDSVRRAGWIHIPVVNCSLLGNGRRRRRLASWLDRRISIYRVCPKYS